MNASIEPIVLNGRDMSDDRVGRRRVLVTMLMLLLLSTSKNMALCNKIALATLHQSVLKCEMCELYCHRHVELNESCDTPAILASALSLLHIYLDDSFFKIALN